jgi:hypothetical protein
MNHSGPREFRRGYREDEPLLLAYHNGWRILLPIIEMWRLFWACNYAWLLPLDWYRWSVNGYEGSEYVCLRVTSLPRRFGLVMHKRGSRFLTLSDWEKIEKAVGLVSDDVFHQLAARFCRVFVADRPEELVLPKPLRPFFHFRFDEAGGSSQPAYRMHPERTWLLLVGVAPGQGVTADDVNWGLFRSPPPSTAAGGEIDWRQFLMEPPAPASST